MAHFDELKEHLHYKRPKPARCLERIKLALCVIGQGAELLSEGLLELIPRRGVPAPLEFLKACAHILMRSYRAEFGIAKIHQGQPCL